MSQNTQNFKQDVSLTKSFPLFSEADALRKSLAKSHPDCRVRVRLRRSTGKFDVILLRPVKKAEEKKA